MGRAALIAFCLGAWATLSAADQTIVAAFGPLRPLMSVEEAMAAAPDLRWQTFADTETGALVGAQAEGFQFNGVAWEVTIGDRFNSPPIIRDDHSLDLQRTFPAANARACRAAIDEIVRLLEPMYGAFGQHPALRSGRNSLYGAPWGSFRMTDVGQSSRMRDYGMQDGLQIFTTFAEIDEANGRAVMIGATFYRETGDCELRIHDFQDRDRARRAAESRAR